MKAAHFGSTMHRSLALRAARPLSSSIRTMPARNRGLATVQAKSGGMGDFFKKDESKQDAARKALQEAFAGKIDPFAAEEERRKKQGGGNDGGGGSGGGGGGGGGSNFNFGDWSDGFRKWLVTTARAIAAALCFFGVIALFTLWQPTIALLKRLVRLALRLDGNPRAQMTAGPAVTPDFNKTEGLGNVEEAVISKWAGEEDVGDEYDTEEED